MIRRAKISKRFSPHFKGFSLETPILNGAFEENLPPGVIYPIKKKKRRR